MNIEEVRQLLKRKFEGPDVLAALRFRLETHLSEPMRDPLSAQVWDSYLKLPHLLKEPFTLLDAGCMSGFLYHHLKRYFTDFTYVGVDKWPEALQVAREYAPEATFIQGDMMSEKFGEFDYVVCSNIPWKSAEQCTDTIRRLAKQANHAVFLILPNTEIAIFERTPASPGNA